MIFQYKLKEARVMQSIKVRSRVGANRKELNNNDKEPIAPKTN